MCRLESAAAHMIALRRLVPYALLPLSLVACVLANAAWLRLQVLTLNLLELLKAVGLEPQYRKARPKRIRLSRPIWSTAATRPSRLRGRTRTS